MNKSPRVIPTDWELLRRFWAFLSPYKGRIGFALFAVPIMTGLSLLQPYLLKVGIDDHILKGELEGLPTIAFTLFALVIGSYLLNGLQSYQLQVAVIRAIGDLRKVIYRHVMSQSSRFFDKHASGSLLTRTTTDVEGLGEMVSMGMLGMFADVLMIVGILGTMLSLDVRLTLLTFCVSPIVVLVVNLFRKKLRVYGLAIRVTLAKLNGYLAEHISGVQVVRFFGRSALSLQEFKAINFEYLSAYKKSNWFDASLYAMMDGLSNICVALMLWYGGLRIVEGDTALSLGLLVAFVEYTTRLFVPVREFSGKIATLQRSMAALQRIFLLLDEDDPIVEGNKTTQDKDRIRLEMKDVHFAYREDSKDVLRGVSFTLEPGRSLALVGRTGSGKSTVGKLLTRTYGGYRGSITINGEELKDLQLDDIRSISSMIHQDVFLFSGTIRDNITLGSAEISEEKVRESIQWVGAEPFISALPGGLDFKVSERGQNLSAGQAQLIAFARAIARDTPFLILDEATSNVDPGLEGTIQAAINKIVQHKTVLIVAHRLSTIEAADEILVLGEGCVLEKGTHAALLAAKGAYADLIQHGLQGEGEGER